MQLSAKATLAAFGFYPLHRPVMYFWQNYWDCTCTGPPCSGPPESRGHSRRALGQRLDLYRQKTARWLSATVRGRLQMV